MARFGPKLYDNDVAFDVKHIYRDMLSVGIDEKEVIEELIDTFSEGEDVLVLWMALADTQWKYGRLEDVVKYNALLSIDYEMKQLEDNNSYSRQRKKELEKLREKLNSPQPGRKNIRKPTFWKSPFQKGDLLLFQIRESEYENDYVKNHKYLNKYILFRVMALGKSTVGFLPYDKYYHDEVVLGLYNWVGEEFGPSDISKLKLYEYEQVHYNLDTLKNEKYLDERFCVLLGETKKEIKRFSLLAHDSQYVKNDILSDKNITSWNMARIRNSKKGEEYSYDLLVGLYNGNIIDYELLKELDKMEESNNLCVEIED